MAKVLLTLEDNEDGTLTASAEFLPELVKNDDGEFEFTGAQAAAFVALEAIKES